MNNAPSAPKTGDLTLTLNAAEGVLQAVFSNAAGQVLHSAQTEAASQGAEKLAPMLAAALAALDTAPAAIARIACVRGPGSFTGLRLAAATAAALARAAHATMAPLDYMPLVAAAYAPQLEEEPAALLWVLTHARRGLVYAQAFRHERTAPLGVAAITELDVLSLHDEGTLAAAVHKTANDCGTTHVVFAGSGATRNKDLLRALPGEIFATAAILADINPAPATLALAATEAAGAVYGTADIVPLYVRPSDAEANLPQLAARLGLDPEDAVRRLHALTTAGPE